MEIGLIALCLVVGGAVVYFVVGLLLLPGFETLGRIRL